MGFVDSYNMIWTLESEDGKRWMESYEGISLSDFATIYETNIFKIVKVEMWVIV